MIVNIGYKDANQVWFLGVDSSSSGQVNTNRVIYTISTKTCKIELNIVNPYQWYMAHGGTVSDQNNFGTINAFLYDNTFIIDEALLSTTITDTAIQDGIKRASILVIKPTDTTKNNIVYILSRSANNTNEVMRTFLSLYSVIGEGIYTDRIIFNTTNNTIIRDKFTLVSPYNTYKRSGGTKYTTESAFNTALAAAIDAYTPTI